MKTYLIPILFIPLFFIACGKDSHEHISESEHGHHVHVAPHGGQLVEVGEHGAGFNLELVLHPDGFLQIDVLDAHAENFVRIPAYSMTFEIQDINNSTKQILCEAVEDPLTGETAGNSSLFTSTERIQEFIPFKGVFTQLDIMEFSYENLSFELSEVPAKPTE